MPLTVLLRCRDLEETRCFYQSVLGFKVRDGAQGTLIAEQCDSVLIFTPHDLWDSNPGFSGTLYFTVVDADGYFASIKDKASITWPIQDMQYGSREFGIKDCNGYHLAFQRAG